MKHAIVMLAYNQTPEQLALSKDTLVSLLAQDVEPLEVRVLNNGSTPETKEWLESVVAADPRVHAVHYDENHSPVELTNFYLGRYFMMGYEFVLGVPNDVVLRPDTFSEFLKWPRGIVTASMTHDKTYDLSTPVEVRAASENTPLCVVLWRKWAYDALIAKDGYFFDEHFAHYCSDQDIALRISACGIRGVQLNLPYWHYGSASHRLAPPEHGDRMRQQADEDRAKFVAKWGFAVFDKAYSDAAFDINFRGEPNDKS